MSVKVSDTIVMPDVYNTGCRHSNDDPIVSYTTLGIEETTALYVSKDFVDACVAAGHGSVTEDGVVTIKKLSFVGCALRFSSSFRETWGYTRFILRDCYFSDAQGLLNSTFIQGTLDASLYTVPNTTGKMPYLVPVFEDGADTSDIHNASGFKDLVSVEYCTFCYAPTVPAAANPQMPLSFDHCLAHHMKSDAFPTDNPGAWRTNCMAYQLGCGYQAHADFIQGSGGMVRYSEDYAGLTKVNVRNCRADLVQYADVDGNTYLSNAVLYCDCDYDDIAVDIDYVWGTGGSYTYRFGTSHDEYKVSGSATHLMAGQSVFKNRTGGLTAIDEGFTDLTVSATYVDNILVGSVWVSNNKVNISVTNYLEEERTFKIVTNRGTTEETIFAAPNFAQYYGTNYGVTNADNPLTYTEDFPHDKLYRIDAARVKWVQIYDTTGGASVLVRTEVFDNTPDPADKVLVSYDKLTHIADEVRRLTDTEDDMTLDEMYEALHSL